MLDQKLDAEAMKNLLGDSVGMLNGGSTHLIQ